MWYCLTLLLTAILVQISLNAAQHCPRGADGKYSSADCGVVDGRNVCAELSAGAGGRKRESHDLLGVSLCHVPIIRNEGDHDRFFGMGGIQMLIYILDEHSHTEVSTFLKNYNSAAKETCAHGITMGLVLCSSYRDPQHCTSEKRGRFVYTYRHGKEIEAKSIDKFPSVDAIATSSLQHSLGGLISIVQTPQERKDLESEHIHKKDLIFAYVDSFNSPAHPYFLDLARKYKDDFAFGLTTYRIATLGLPLPDDFKTRPAALWILQCSQPPRKEIFDDRSVICPGTFYSGGHEDIDDFLASFQLPLYHEIQTEDIRDPANPLKTAFKQTDLPYAIFVYDSKSEPRIRAMISDFAKFFRGNLAVHIALQGVIQTQAINRYLGIRVEELRPPSLIFFKPGQSESVSFVNDFESPYGWLKEKLEVYLSKKYPKIKENKKLILEEENGFLDQDDELVTSMTCEKKLTGVPAIPCPKSLRSIISQVETSAAIAFYLPYDPMSNKVLQVLNTAASTIQDLNSKSTIHKFDCFDYTKICDSMGIVNFPTVVIFDSQGRPKVYDGAIEANALTNSILVSGCSNNPKELHSSQELDNFLERPCPSCLASSYTSTRVAGIFPDQRAQGNSVFKSISESHMSEFLFAHMEDQRVAQNMCPSASGCILVSKPDDPFQKQVFITENLRDKDRTIIAIRKAAMNALAPLDDARQSIFSSVKDSSGSASHVILLLKSSVCQMKLKSYADSNSNLGSKDLASDDFGLMTAVGRMASESSRMDFIVSYIDKKNPMRESVLNEYKLSSDRNHVIAIDGSKGQVAVFTSASWTESSIKKWFENVLIKNVSANMVLSPGDWKPHLPTYDYLSSLREFYEREETKTFAFERAEIGLNQLSYGS